MDNQHKLIKGYRDLSPQEIALMNKIKVHAEFTEALLAEVNAHVCAQFISCTPTVKMNEGDFDVATNRSAAQQAEFSRLTAAEPHRWKAVARTDFQTGFMALVRAVAQPTSF